ncbi:MAG: hypothetical protein Q4C70_07055 [Planctomycetia bacterium]|nr:hypothetical protein [Planctomycetia bacterium]
MDIEPVEDTESVVAEELGVVRQVFLHKIGTFLPLRKSFRHTLGTVWFQLNFR